MLKTTELLNLDSKVFRIYNNKVIRDDSGKANKTIVNSSNKLKNSKSRNLICIPNIKVTGKLILITLNAKKTFNYLRQIFIKALIL